MTLKGLAKRQFGLCELRCVSLHAGNAENAKILVHFGQFWTLFGKQRDPFLQSTKKFMILAKLVSTLQLCQYTVDLWLLSIQRQYTQCQVALGLHLIQLCLADIGCPIARMQMASPEHSEPLNGCKKV